MADDEKATDGKSKEALVATGAFRAFCWPVVIAAGGGVYLGAGRQFGKQDPRTSTPRKMRMARPGEAEKYTDGSRHSSTCSRSRLTSPVRRRHWIRLEAAVVSIRECCGAAV